MQVLHTNLFKRTVLALERSPRHLHQPRPQRRPTVHLRPLPLAPTKHHFLSTAERCGGAGEEVAA